MEKLDMYNCIAWGYG